MSLPHYVTEEQVQVSHCRCDIECSGLRHQHLQGDAFDEAAWTAGDQNAVLGLCSDASERHPRNAAQLLADHKGYLGCSDRRNTCCA